MIGIEAYMQASSSAFVIRMYLPEGVPEGIRIVERSNWVGQAVICPHSRFTSVRERPEAESAGVYVLLGQEEENDLPMAYIGEADPLIDRLLQHYRNKDWWTSVVFFVSKDRQLNKAHIQYLEAKLVQLARSANRCRLENANQPAEPSLSDMDQAEMEGFLAHMLQIYPILGVDLFQTPGRAAPGVTLYHLSVKGGQATGFESGEGFVVRAGSPASKETSKTLKATILRLRDQLAELGVLQDTGDQYRFVQDYVFNSPSTAAKVVRGYEINGRTEWKTEAGVPLKEIQNSVLDLNKENRSSTATAR
jgi:hypothetical protein